MQPRTSLPETLPAGTTIKYVRSVPDYPASAGWQLRLALAGPSTLQVTSTPSGPDHVITITAAQSAALTPGLYQWSEDALLNGEVYRVADGNVPVEPNLATAQPGALVSEDERMYAAIVAVIEARLGVGGSTPKDIETYQIDGIAVSKVPLEVLVRERVRLATAIARARRGGWFGRQHRVTFTKPGTVR